MKALFCNSVENTRRERGLGGTALLPDVCFIILWAPKTNVSGAYRMGYFSQVGYKGMKLSFVNMSPVMLFFKYFLTVIFNALDIHELLALTGSRIPPNTR